MLGHRVRRFRLENVLSKATSRSVRIQSPAFQALNAVNISSNFLQSNAYSTSCIVASSVGASARTFKPEVESTPIDFAAISSDEITPSPDGSELLKFHAENFYDPSKQNVYDVRSGSYVDVKEEDIANYFQEGLAGAANDEFEFTSNKRWMVRDSTKVLFRIIEETEKRLKYDASAFLEKTNKKSISTTIDSSAHVGLHSKIQIPRFQGKAEWPESQMKVSYYGRDLVPTNFDASAEVEGFIKTKGPGSILEKTIENLKNATKESNQEIPDRVILSGGRGHGKSMVLNQAVLYARQRGWLTVFVPNGWEQVQNGPYIQPMTLPGAEKKVVYDNPYMDKVFLRGLWRAHKEQLKALPLSSKDILSKYEAKLQTLRRSMQLALQLPGRDKMSFIELRSIIIEDEDRLEEYDTLDADCLNQYNFMANKLETLEDLLKLGVAFDLFSGLVVRDLIMELRQQTQIPVLFAVDEYNTWFMPSAFGYEEKGRLLGKDLNLPDALLFLDTKKKGGAATNWTLNHGLCLAATSFTHAEAMKRSALVRFDTELKDSLPLRIKVNAYTQEEYLSAVSYYFQTGTSPVAAVASWEDFFLFRMVTMSNPRLVRYENMKFFFPRNVAGLEQELEMAALLGVSDPTKMNRAEDFDPTLGFNEDSEDEEKTDDDEEVVEAVMEKESFLGAIERKDEDDYYPDLEDDDDEDYGSRRT